MGKFTDSIVYGVLDVKGVVSVGDRLECSSSGAFSGNVTAPNFIGTSTKVSNNLILKLNGGSTEGTNQITFNGESPKTINITPQFIGAVGSTGDGASGTWNISITGTASNTSKIDNLPSTSLFRNGGYGGDSNADNYGSFKYMYDTYNSTNVNFGASTNARGVLTLPTHGASQSFTQLGFNGEDCTLHIRQKKGTWSPWYNFLHTNNCNTLGIDWSTNNLRFKTLQFYHPDGNNTRGVMGYGTLGGVPNGYAINLNLEQITSGYRNFAITNSENVVVPSGKFGVGVSSPVAKAHIVNEAHRGWGLFLDSNNVAHQSYGALIAGGTSSQDWCAQFVTKNGAKALCIRGDSNVGFGTEAPNAKVHVNGGGIFVQSTGGYWFGPLSSPRASIVANWADDLNVGMTLRTCNASNTSNIDAVYIKHNGNVSFGHTNPTETVDVNGYIKASLGLKSRNIYLGDGSMGGDITITPHTTAYSSTGLSWKVKGYDYGAFCGLLSHNKDSAERISIGFANSNNTAVWGSNLGMNIFPNGNVAIGANTARTTLDVYGLNAAAIVGKTSGSGNTGKSHKLRLGLATTEHTGSQYWCFSIDDNVALAGESLLRIGYTMDKSILSMTGSSKLGVNKVVPTEALDVVGNGLFSGSVKGASVYDSGNRVYSAINNNIGGGATNYAAGNHTHSFTVNMVYATDQRDVKPNTSGIGNQVKGIKPFFVANSMFGLGGTYSDMIHLDTYSDASGGKVNSLICRKDVGEMYYIQSEFNSASWGSPMRIWHSGNLNRGDVDLSCRNITVTGAVNQTSSRAFKTNINPFVKNALDILSSVNIVDFNYKNSETPHIGFIAEDTPCELSTTQKNTMDIGSCVGVLIKAVQELSVKCDTYERLLSNNKNGI